MRDNEHKGRFFVSLTAWKVGILKDASAGASEDDPTIDQLTPPADSHDGETTL